VAPGPQFTSADVRRLVVQVLSDAASGQIRPVIGQRFSLEHAADAHAAIEARDVIGKTLLVI
jgi:NADPH2:quinone reductase